MVLIPHRVTYAWKDNRQRCITNKNEQEFLNHFSRNSRDIFYEMQFFRDWKQFVRYWIEVSFRFCPRLRGKSYLSEEDGYRRLEKKVSRFAIPSHRSFEWEATIARDESILTRKE